MSLLELTVAFISLFVLSFFGTGTFVRYAYAKGILDKPNHRSSHEVPTPTGGGIIVVGCLLILWFSASVVEVITLIQALALIIPGAIVAIIGFVDDKQSIPRRWRLATQVIAILMALYLLYPMPDLPLWENIRLSLSGPMIALIGIAIIWLTNLYNFMDGIDGIAASEAITVLLGAVIITWTSGHTPLSTLFLLAIAPILGFLLWNRPPAKVFMGDACSTFLGLTFGLLALISLEIAKTSLWCWAILLATFITDATWTLATRIITQQDWRSPHRSHIYQLLSPKKQLHLRTTSIYSAINIFWLFPLAYLANESKEHALIFLALAYIPLLILTQQIRQRLNRQATTDCQNV